MTQENHESILVAIARVETKLETLDDIKGILKDHETRIRIGERWQNNTMGKIAVIGSVFGFIGVVATAFIKDWISRIFDK